MKNTRTTLVIEIPTISGHVHFHFFGTDNFVIYWQIWNFVNTLFSPKKQGQYINKKPTILISHTHNEIHGRLDRAPDISLLLIILDGTIGPTDRAAWMIPTWFRWLLYSSFNRDLGASNSCVRIWAAVIGIQCYMLHCNMDKINHFWNRPAPNWIYGNELESRLNWNTPTVQEDQQKEYLSAK